MVESKSDAIGWLDRVLVHSATLLKHVIAPINMWLLKTSNGRLGNSFLGVSVLLLYTIGSKSGLKRVTPLFYLRHQEKIVLVASNGGNAKNPAWVDNLNANPEAKVKIKGKETKVHAHIANAEEHQRYWPMMTEMFFIWREAQERSVREFPIAVLEPRGTEWT